MRSCRQRALRRGALRDRRHLWQVPTGVAVTAALAQGGFALGPEPPPGATPIDEIALAQVVPANGSLAIPLPVSATATTFVTALGLDTSDAVNTRFSTRINGVVVAPYNQETGSPGPTAAPVALPSPIVVPAGSTFDLFIEDVSGAGLTIGARIQGFSF